MAKDKTPSDVSKMIKDHEVKLVDFKFTDLPGTWQHFTSTLSDYSDDIFTDGLGFDGSSIRGWKAINASDMLVIPDPTTAWIDIFNAEPTLSRVIGSTIVQMSESVGSALKMSIHAVVGSGITSMSDALITFQPRMLDPSKPRPSVKMSSLYSLSVVVKCCHVPGRSVNLKSINLTLLSLIILLTSDGVVSLAMMCVQA